ncbi:MAG: hypothetical protein LBF83_00325 [Spirochaetaceae bacterium]|jgi:hypothetical protein|nr:hypothetical protein [Spirochaetaceae bacterium]
MTAWDILDKVINASVLPLWVVALFLAAGIVFIVGFGRHGIDFIKHGFSQNSFSGLVEKLATKEDINSLKADMDGFKADMGRLDTRIAAIETNMDGFKVDMGRLDTRIAAIETNHFGHLKDFLTELTSILVDKNVLTNQDKARLDNKLRGM